MVEQIFTFWEGELPEYVKLCMSTWKFPYTVLNYNNLSQYTDLAVSNNLKKYTLAQISDCVRVHVLRDNGGYWLDADTIMLSSKLPEENMVGVPKDRNAHCGYLHFEKNSTMLKEWAEKQDIIIYSGRPGKWDLFANSLSDPIIKKHEDITIKDRTLNFPEQYIMHEQKAITRYRKFYFESNYELSDIKPTEMLMLHNSWTPTWYKELNRPDILSNTCTLSNILREVLSKDD